MSKEDIHIMVHKGTVAVGRAKCQAETWWWTGHNEQGNVFLMNLFYKRNRSAFQFISFLPFPLPPLSSCSSWNPGILNRDEFRLFPWLAKCASPFCRCLSTFSPFLGPKIWQIHNLLRGLSVIWLKCILQWSEPRNGHRNYSFYFLFI